MVVVNLMGGLGNQMFQYAVARSLTQENEKVWLDLNFLSHNNESREDFVARPFALNIFAKINGRPLDTYAHNLIYNTSLSYKFLRRIVYSIKNVNQYENQFHPELLTARGNIYLNGYFQSEKYFKHIRNALLHEFTFPEADTLLQDNCNQIAVNENPVSIHIRRGDYLKPAIKKVHGILPVTYYEAAMNFIQQRVQDPFFIVFSDDIEWCRENLPMLNANTVFITTDADWKDMYLMTQCKHHIVANSSFSWWGAWLAKREGFKLAPDKWFNPEVVKFDIHDFIPESWQIISYG